MNPDDVRRKNAMRDFVRNSKSLNNEEKRQLNLAIDANDSDRFAEILITNLDARVVDLQNRMSLAETALEWQKKKAVK